MSRISETSTRAIASLVDFCRRRSGLVIVGYALLTTASIVWSLLHLRVDAGSRDFMSPDLPWRQDAIALQKAFPAYDRSVLAVIDAPTPERAEDVRAAVRDAIAKLPDIARVVAPGDGDFFARNGLLYLDADALADTASQIQQAQPFFGRLSAHPNLAGLAGLLTDAYTHADAAGGVPLAKATGRIADALDAAREHPGTRLSWQNLLADEAAKPARLFLVALPKDGHANDDMVDAVRDAVDATAPKGEAGTSVRLTGEVVMQADERAGISYGIQDTIWSSLFGVAAILWFAMRSASRVAICLGSTLIGLALTTGFAVVAIGRLTLISAAFAALYIGIAIAFALHFCMRLEELRSEGGSYDDAMKVTATDVGTALLLSALATAAGFFAFVPTPYVAVRELGIISGTGLLIGFFVTVTLVPALLERAPKPKPRPLRNHDRGPRKVLHPRIVQAGAAIVAIAAIVTITHLRFDFNPMHLTPRTDAYGTFEALLASGDAPLNASILEPDAGKAGAVAEQLAKVPQVREARWLGSFVPEDQEDKLAQIDDLRFSVGATLPKTLALDPPDPARDVAALQALRDTAKNFAGDPATVESAHRLAASLDAWLSPAPDAAKLAALSDTLLGDLPRLVGRLSKTMEAGPVTLDDLPDDLRAMWVGVGGTYKIEAVPAENIDDDHALVRFADAVKAVAPHATGSPIEFVESTRAVIHAFGVAFSLAVLSIGLFLALLLGSVADTFRALAPLILGTLVLCAVLVGMGRPLNMASVIGLPLLLGTNVDAAIHLILRAREAGTAHLSQTSTARAVVYLVLTEAVGYASLIVSPHRGIATLGELLTLGLAITLGCIMLLLPALLPAPPAMPDSPTEPERA